jgi:NAD-dependent SIR2 family protein deacetylase
VSAHHPSLAPLAAALAGRRVAVLTGAGCSTESGIPDYRSPEALRRPRTPLLYQDFIKKAETRRRYWARSLVGWPRMSAARPNPAHVALAELEAAGVVTGLVTQNVDGLHQAAGSARVIELHGALAHVRCLVCGARFTRRAVQARLEAANPGFAARAAALAPDGDADLPDAAIAELAMVDCETCGGALKPDVVLFGENVPRPTVDAAFALVDAAEALLVVGSSLTVYSGFRFVRRAAERGQPVVIVNQGPTRGDPHARLRVDARAGEILPALRARLAPAA